MQQSYWDISDILADSCRIPCTFNLDVPHLSYLRGDAAVDQHMTDTTPASSQASASAAAVEADIIREKSRLEIPFWLAEMLALNDIVTPSLPRPYSQRVRNALDADAKSVQLRTQSNWWYALGVRLASLHQGVDAEAHHALLNVLSTCYAGRMSNVYSSAQHLAARGATGLNSGSAIAGSSGGKGSDGGRASASSGGGGFGNRASSSIGMSAEMIDFVNGLEETEKVGEYVDPSGAFQRENSSGQLIMPTPLTALSRAHDAAAAMMFYLTGRN